MNARAKRGIAVRTALAGLALSAMIGGALGGCAVLAPSYDPVLPAVDPQVAVELAYSRESYLEARDALFSARPASVEAWWTRYDDPALTAIVEAALEGNRTVAQASANVRAARALLNLSEKEYIPTDAQELSYQRVGFSQTNPFGIPDQTLLDASIGALWELDLFGRIERTIEVAEADLAQGEALLADIQSLVAADTAGAYLEMRGLEAQMRVVRENIDSLAQTVELTIIIRDAGRGTDLDVERAREQLASTQSLLPPLEAARDAALYRLGVLAGMTPPEVGARLAEGPALPRLGGGFDVGAPEALLRRRPDILAAEFALVEANATIGLRRSEAFPVVGFLGSFGLTAAEEGRIFNSDAVNFATGPALSFSAAEFVRAQDRVEAARAGAEAQLATYEQAVLVALAEVETALALNRALRAQVRALEESRRAANEAAALARIRFENGATTFLTVLDAERRAIEARTAVAQVRTSIALSEVDIFRTLRAGPSGFGAGSAAGGAAGGVVSGAAGGATVAAAGEPADTSP